MHCIYTKTITETVLHFTSHIAVPVAVRVYWSLPVPNLDYPLNNSKLPCSPPKHLTGKSVKSLFQINKFKVQKFVSGKILFLQMPY